LIKLSSFACIAWASRFCVAWIKNTIRNVSTVVLVFIISCQVSDQLKIGPEMNHNIVNTHAIMNASGAPTSMADRLENFANWSCTFIILIRGCVMHFLHFFVSCHTGGAWSHDCYTWAGGVATYVVCTRARLTVAV
jgi:hypothetical protein